ncbi:glycosyltransferase [Acinetobacter radioresistens]|uniref:glycosyltransferase family 2 protein n=1 Tax=Acinetobacter radioresistens TaxID=40216 RepID=UPI0035580380
MSLSNKDDIQVSVCVVTYNQQKYIAECLESLVTQQTSFKFEIIVGEDCSTDGTRAIVQQYVEQYPDLIVPLFYEENVGAVENVKRVYKAAKGKYIAHMDGDDMALPGKLQKQFDILESNLDCTVCGHDVNYIDADGKYISSSSKNINKKIDRLEFIKDGISFTHSSKMFVNNVSKDFWDELLINKNMIDYEIHIEFLKNGKFTYINEILGQYRRFTGLSLDRGKISPILLAAPDRIYSRLLNEYCEVEEKRIVKSRYALEILRLSFQVALVEGDKAKFRSLVLKSVEINRFSLEQIIFLLGAIWPSLFISILKYRDKIKKSNRV